MQWILLTVGLVLGSALGAAVVWAMAQRKVASAESRAKMLDENAQTSVQEMREVRSQLRDAETELARANERLKAFEEAEKKLLAVFEATGAKLLQTNTDRFMQQAEKSFEEKAKPIRELLDAQKKAVEDIEKKRETAYVRLDEQIKQIAQSHEKLGSETGRLVAALRRPEQRGRWGEMQLRNAVELAGMTNHCDFHEQVQTDDSSTRDRPDMIVNLPGGGVIVVDSKVSLDAYLNSIDPDADRAAELQRHARQVETHVRSLASKAYWDQFDKTPRLVVMFMPLESALHAALEIKPDMHAEAMKQHVLITTPTLLIALLRAVAYGWQQEAIAENAKEIADVGHELYERLAIFTGHLERVGKGLDSAATSYNRAVGSLESRVLPSTRRLRELRATNRHEIEQPSPVEIDIRDVTSAELKSSLPGAVSSLDGEANPEQN